MEQNRTRAASFFPMDNRDFWPRGAPHSGYGRFWPPLFALEHLDRTRARPAPAPAAENPSRATDFSIERILSADLGNKTPVERTPSPALPGSFALPYLQCVFYPSYPVAPMAIDPQAFTYNVTVCGAGQRSQDVRQAQQQQQQQWKPRVRTVFTDSQLQRLEELFERTRYPCPETREELARSIGLSEDAVRIWFKNHRARRKRQTNAPQSTQDHL